MWLHQQHQLSNNSVDDDDDDDDFVIDLAPQYSRRNWLDSEPALVSEDTNLSDEVKTRLLLARLLALQRFTSTQA